MSIDFGYYDEETRLALLSAINAGIEKALDDEAMLASFDEAVEEVGIEITGQRGIPERGEFSAKLRVHRPKAAEPKAVGRFRQRLQERGICG